jgi:hypothetical protein
VHLIIFSHFPSLFEHELPRSICRKRAKCVALLYPVVRSLDLFLWAYVKNYVHSLIFFLLDELIARSTVPTADVTKDMSQRAWQQVGLRWDVCRTTDATHCKTVSLLATFPFCVKELFHQLVNKIRQTIPSYLFPFLVYRCLKSQYSFW